MRLGGGGGDHSTFNIREMWGSLTDGGTHTVCTLCLKKG